MRLTGSFRAQSNLSAAEPRLPEKLDSAGLLVGWSMEHIHRRQPVGFTFGDPDRTPEDGFVDPILLDREGHLVTIAPTGAGKGVGCIIPALLRHEGPAIVIDPKGENAMVTARRRREMGQEVVVIDPAGITGLPSGSFNPLDIINPEEASGVDIARAMTHALLPEDFDGERNRYWASRARQLLLALILNTVTDRPAEERTLATVRAGTSELASTTGKWANRFMRSRHPEVRTIAGNLQIGASDTLGSIVSFAQEGVDFLGGPQIDAVIRSTSFNLDAVTRGDPLTLYIVLPPHLLESYGRLLRLWISSLIALITRRRARPKKPTLFILDEAAQLGELEELRQAVTLLRGYGLQTWSFWQDVSQIRHLYRADWQTMLNNCAVIQTFGPNNLNAARDMASITGFVSAEAFLALERHEMLLQIAGDEAVVAKLPSYLTDPIFSGQFDANPMFDPDTDPVPEPNPVREYLRAEKADVEDEQAVEIPGVARVRKPKPRREAKARLTPAPGKTNPVDTMLAKELEKHVAEEA